MCYPSFCSYHLADRPHGAQRSRNCLPFVFVGFKGSQLKKKLQPISSRDNPPSRLQFFDLQTKAYLHEVKQIIEIIFA
jgi:hypothetical protein